MSEKKQLSKNLELYRDTILEMYKQGLGISTIGTRLRVSVSMITKLVREAGIMRPRKDALRLANNMRKGEKRLPYEVI